MPRSSAARRPDAHARRSKASCSVTCACTETGAQELRRDFYFLGNAGSGFRQARKSLCVAEIRVSNNYTKISRSSYLLSHSRREYDRHPLRDQALLECLGHQPLDGLAPTLA